MYNKHATIHVNVEHAKDSYSVLWKINLNLIFTPLLSWMGYLFSLQFVLVCVCVVYVRVYVCVCLNVCLSACTLAANPLIDFDAVFVKQCLVSMVRSSLKMVILNQTSRSPLWRSEIREFRRKRGAWPEQDLYLQIGVNFSTFKHLHWLILFQ